MNEKILKKLEEIDKKLTILLILQLAQVGLTSKDIGKILNIDDSTVRHILPLSKIKGVKDEKTKKK